MRIMQRQPVAFVAGLALLGLVALSAQSAEDPETWVVARYTDGEVTAADVERYLGSLPLHLQGPNERDVPLVAWTKDRVRQLVTLREMLRRAKASDLEKTEAAFVRFWRINHDVRARAASRRVDEMARPSEEEMREYYEGNKDRFHFPQKLRFRYIFTNADNGGWEGAAERIEKVYAELAEGRDFVEVAREYSETGGLPRTLGEEKIVPLGKMNPALEKALLDLVPGDFSQPVMTTHGYHIALLLEMIPERLLSYEEAREAIQNILLSDRVKEVREELDKKLQEAYPITLFPEVLEDEKVYPNSIVARMDDQEVSAKRYIETLDALPSSERTDEYVRQLREQYLEQAVEHLRTIAAARYLKVEEDPKVQKELREKKDRALAQLQLDLAVDEAMPDLTEEKLRAFYEEHREKFNTRRMVRGRSMKIDFGEPEEGTLREKYLARMKAKSQLDDIRKQILEGADFAEMARKYSVAANASQGGLLDWAERHGHYFDMNTRGLAEGELSGIVEGHDGWLLFMVEGIREPVGQPYESVKFEVADRWRKTKRFETRQALIEKTTADLGLAFEEDAFEGHVKRMFPEGNPNFERATLTVGE